VIEHALFSAGIPYRVYGGLRFFERQEVKHALAYLRLLANPDDDAAFLRVVNFPARGVGSRSVEALQDAARAAGASLWQAIPQLAGKSAAAVGAFAKLVTGLREATAARPLPEIVGHVIEASGLVAHYKAERDGADRVENLTELVNAAAAFVQDEAYAAQFVADAAETPAAPGDPLNALGSDMTPPASVATESVQRIDALNAFLAHAALESGENQAGEGADALQMMTVHSAKGLEFHCVFISGLEEGLFPHEQSVVEEDGLEEERRLMYVAITRARTRLYLSFAQTRLLHGQTRYGLASRFLDELPKGLIKWLSAKTGVRLDAQAWRAEPPPARMKARSAGARLPFRIGQNVVHPKFGQGVIVSAEGSGEDARLQINFGREGMKWLQLGYAKLTAA
jgi:DNA helicase-2/ATP-dependent DNA helicase PcrA